MKKLTLALMIFTTMGSSFIANAAEDPVSMLELADPDYPGGTYDVKIEMQKKVDEVSNLQMQPHQVDVVKNMLLEQQRATATPYTHTAKPVTRSLNVNFEPGKTPPVIRLSSNMLSTLVFTDAVGNPWNIAGVALNRNLFSDGADINSGVTYNPDTKSGDAENAVVKNHNILSLEPLNPVAYGNVAVTLEGLDTPVILLLTTGQSEVDLRVDARISGINPNRQFKTKFSISKASTDVDDVTLLFVDGTPPKDALQLKTSSNEIEAWELDDQLVIRTKHNILYPAFVSSVTSSSGVTVYRLNNENQAVTITKGKSPKTIYIDKP